jgi:CRISPR-associated protein Csb1
MPLTLEQLDKIIELGAAIRRRRRFVPTAGEGASIAPPTYPDRSQREASVHLFEDRRLDGEWRHCVVLDTVQSQANRLEEILEQKVSQGEIAMPRLVVDLEVPGVGLNTSLTVPHRIYDAILRDSVIDEGGVRKVLRKSALGSRINDAFSSNATAIFETAPNTLLFGGWNSTWGNPRGAKFPRCIVSEIIGIDARPGLRAAGRMDPLVIDNVKVYQKAGAGDADPGYTADENKADHKKGKPVAFSMRQDGKAAPEVTDINHGMIPPTVVHDHGVSVDRIDQIAVINMPSLRQLSFPLENGQTEETLLASRNRAARSVLALMGLVGLTAFGAGGVALRSRCELATEDDPAFEVLGCEPDSFTMTNEEATVLFSDATSRLGDAGFTWETEPLVLAPADDFRELVIAARITAVN